MSDLDDVLKSTKKVCKDVAVLWIIDNAQNELAALRSRIAELESALKISDEIVEQWDAASMPNFETSVLEVSFAEGNKINSLTSDYRNKRIALEKK